MKRAHRRASAVLGSSLAGALVGAVIVFMNRPQKPPNVWGPDGMELIHPMYVGRVPLWFYATVALVCALAAACVAIIVLRIPKPPRH